MDIDFIVERNNRFLVYETKGASAEMGVGQRRLLEALSTIPAFTVATVWGKPDATEAIQQCSRGVWGERQRFSNEQLATFTNGWWQRVANGGGVVSAPKTEAFQLDIPEVLKGNDTRTLEYLAARGNSRAAAELLRRGRK